MSVEVHIEWAGATHRVGRLHTAERSPTVTFEYAPEWLARGDAFAIDPTWLPLRTGAQHAPVLFGAMQDCGPDRWSRVLIERATLRLQWSRARAGAERIDADQVRAPMFATASFCSMTT